MGSSVSRESSYLLLDRGQEAQTGTASSTTKETSIAPQCQRIDPALASLRRPPVPSPGQQTALWPALGAIRSGRAQNVAASTTGVPTASKQSPTLRSLVMLPLLFPSTSATASPGALAFSPRYPELRPDLIPFGKPESMMRSYRSAQVYHGVRNQSEPLLDIMNRIVDAQGRLRAHLLSVEMTVTPAEDILDAINQMSWCGNPALDPIEALIECFKGEGGIEFKDVVRPSREQAERLLVSFLAYRQQAEWLRDASGAGADPVAEAIRPMCVANMPAHYPDGVGGVTGQRNEPLRRAAALPAREVGGAGGSREMLEMNRMGHEFRHLYSHPAYVAWLMSLPSDRLKLYVDEALTECLTTELWTGHWHDTAYEQQGSAKVCRFIASAMGELEGKPEQSYALGLSALRHAIELGQVEPIERLAVAVERMLEELDDQHARNRAAMSTVALLLVVTFIGAALYTLNA